MDALHQAGEVARRMAADPAVAEVSPSVLPVAGLLGMAGRTLRHGDFVALRSLAGTPPGELQRVLLARALLARPDLLVLDEPVQGVDFAGEAALYRLIGQLREWRGCGVLMISHDLHVVMAATDGRFFKRRWPRVYRFNPFRMTKAQRASLHNADEHLAVDDYLAGIGWYRALIRAL